MCRTGNRLQGFLRGLRFTPDQEAGVLLVLRGAIGAISDFAEDVTVNTGEVPHSVSGTPAKASGAAPLFNPKGTSSGHRDRPALDREEEAELDDKTPPADGGATPKAKAKEEEEETETESSEEEEDEEDDELPGDGKQDERAVQRSRSWCWSPIATTTSTTYGTTICGDSFTSCAQKREFGGKPTKARVEHLAQAIVH